MQSLTIESSPSDEPILSVEEVMGSLSQGRIEGTSIAQNELYASWAKQKQHELDATTKIGQEGNIARLKFDLEAIEILFISGYPHEAFKMFEDLDSYAGGCEDEEFVNKFKKIVSLFYEN